MNNALKREHAGRRTNVCRLSPSVFRQARSAQRLQHPPPPMMREPLFLEQPHLEELNIQATLSLPKKAVNLGVARVAENTAVAATAGLAPIAADMAEAQPLVGAPSALVRGGHIQQQHQKAQIVEIVI